MFSLHGFQRKQVQINYKDNIWLDMNVVYICYWLISSNFTHSGVWKMQGHVLNTRDIHFGMVNSPKSPKIQLVSLSALQKHLAWLEQFLVGQVRRTLSGKLDLYSSSHPFTLVSSQSLTGSLSSVTGKGHLMSQTCSSNAHNQSQETTYLCVS